MSAGEYKITLKKFLNLAIESVLGFCASCIIVLPSVLDLVGNPRSIVHFSNNAAPFCKSDGKNAALIINTY